MSARVHNEFFAGAHFDRAYAFKAAPQGYSDSVFGLWHSRFEQLPGQADERLFAQLSASIVLHQGGSFFIEREEGLQEITESVVIGPHTAPLLFHHLPDNRLSGLKLKPGGFYRLLGIPADLVQNQVIPLRELLRSSSCQQVENLPASLQEYSYTADLYKYDCVRRALAYYTLHIMDNPGLEELARHLNLGAKTLHRYFLETIGTGPRKACSVTRIRVALQASSNNGFSVYHYGYTDNSHFYKDLRQYTSLGSLKRS